MGVKVAIVGAGSTYTPELVEGFIRRADRFPVDELALLDVDPSRLEVVGGLARRMLDRAGFGGRTVLTGDRDEAIDGAAFVIVQLRVGGQAARLLDETIPLRFGCIGQETTGAGGFAKALRTVPVVLELAELAGRRGAPGCWFIDFTNPTGLVTQALLDREVRAIGLCNVAIGFQRRFAERFGVEPERVELEQVGLNHLSWVRAVKVDGVDRLPELLETDLAELSADAEVPPELLRALGAIPSYYLRYYYRTREMFERQTPWDDACRGGRADRARPARALPRSRSRGEAAAARATRRRVLQRGRRAARRVARIRDGRRAGRERSQRRGDPEPR